MDNENNVPEAIEKAAKANAGEKAAMTDKAKEAAQPPAKKARKEADGAPNVGFDPDACDLEQCQKLTEAWDKDTCDLASCKELLKVAGLNGFGRSGLGGALTVQQLEETSKTIAEASGEQKKAASLAAEAVLDGSGRLIKKKEEELRELHDLENHANMAFASFVSYHPDKVGPAAAQKAAAERRA